MEASDKCLLLSSTAKVKLSSQKIGIFLEFCNLVATVILTFLEKLVSLFLPATSKSLNKDVILITGSADGLGKEICKQLATSGAKLVLWDVASQANHDTAQLLRQLGATHVFEDTVDLADRDQIVKAAEKIRSTVGHVTILVNNAGVAHINHFLDLSPAAVREVFDVNVLSHFWTIQEFLPHMIKNGSGHIVTIASTMSYMTIRGSTPYFSSKHSVHGLIECLKDELADQGCNNVKFTTAYPFFFRTNMVKDLDLKFKFNWLTPFLEVSYVAERVVDGIRSEKEFVYVPRTFHIYMFLKPFLPTKVHQALVNFCIEECNIPTINKEDAKQETLYKHNANQVSQDTPYVKNRAYLSPIHKRELTTETRE